MRAVLQGEKSEAARVIFLGWPGQHELDDEEGCHTPPGHGRSEASLDSCLQLPPLMSKAGVTTAQPPLALNADCVRAQNGRQLGCVLCIVSCCHGIYRVLCTEMCCALSHVSIRMSCNHGPLHASS